jgi:hypothetical protein
MLAQFRFPHAACAWSGTRRRTCLCFNRFGSSGFSEGWSSTSSLAQTRCSSAGSCGLRARVHVCCHTSALHYKMHTHTHTHTHTSAPTTAQSQMRDEVGRGHRLDVQRHAQAVCSPARCVSGRRHEARYGASRANQPGASQVHLNARCHVAPVQ